MGLLYRSSSFLPLIAAPFVCCLAAIGRSQSLCAAVYHLIGLVVMKVTLIDYVTVAKIITCNVPLVLEKALVR